MELLWVWCISFGVFWGLIGVACLLYSRGKNKTIFSLRSTKSDFGYTLVGNALFALGVTATVWLAQEGHTELYAYWGSLGWPYLFLSLPILILVHDAYFYWVHRILHLQPLFRAVHHVHHRSTDPTPLSAMAMHPAEAFLEALFIPLAACFIPIHPVLLAAFVLFVMAFNVFGHFGHPRSVLLSKRPSFLRFIATTQDHTVHHEYYRKNYGAYFHLWDRIFGTYRAPDRSS